MTKKHYHITLIFLAMGLLLTTCNANSCNDPLGCVEIAPEAPIKIGVLQDFSGGAAAVGQTQLKSIELAIKNRDGQLLKHTIELQTEDTKCLPEGGTTAALKFAADPQLIGVIGTTCSGSATTASQVMSEAGLVMLSGTNAAADLTSIGNKQGANWYPGYYRTMWNGSEQGRIAALFVFQELGLTKAATISDESTFTQQLTDVFKQVFEDLGGEVVMTGKINTGDTNMHPLLAALATQQTDAIFFPIYMPEGAWIIQQAREIAGLENVTLIGSGVLQVEEMVGTIGEQGTGVYFTGIKPLKTEATEKLLLDYTNQHNEEPRHNSYPYAYDATNLLLNALENTAIRKMNNRLIIGRQALREALYATSNFDGVTGKLSCSPYGDCGVLNVNIVRLDDPSAGLEGLLNNEVYAYTTGN